MHRGAGVLRGQKIVLIPRVESQAIVSCPFSVQGTGRDQYSGSRGQHRLLPTEPSLWSHYVSSSQIFSVVTQEKPLGQMMKHNVRLPFTCKSKYFTVNVHILVPSDAQNFRV